MVLELESVVVLLQEMIMVMNMEKRAKKVQVECPLEPTHLLPSHLTLTLV